MGYVSAHCVIAINPEMKERVKNLEKYRDELIYKMKLNSTNDVHTYTQDTVPVKGSQKNNKRTNKFVNQENKVETIKRTYVDIASSVNNENYCKQLNKRS